MTDSPVYVDVEDLLMTWLKDRFGTQNVVDELPYNLTFVMPLIVVERYGGGRRLTIDDATVDVDVFQPTRAAAKTYANQITTAIDMELPGFQFGAGHVSRVRNISGPSIAPWDSNRDIRRATFAYAITVKTQL